MDHRGVLAVQVAQRHGVYQLGRVQFTEKVRFVEGVARVLNHPGIKPEVTAGAGGAANDEGCALAAINKILPTVKN